MEIPAVVLHGTILGYHPLFDPQTSGREVEMGNKVTFM
jgi:hypothetical protein